MSHRRHFAKAKPLFLGITAALLMASAIPSTAQAQPVTNSSLYYRMGGEVFKAFRIAKTRQVLLAGAVDHGKLAQRTRDQSRVFQRADAHHAVKSFANNIHQPIAAAQLQLNPRILLQKGR